MVFAVHSWNLISSRFSPEQKNQRVFAGTQKLYDTVGKLFPALTMMRLRFSRTNCERSVEQ